MHAQDFARAYLVENGASWPPRELVEKKDGDYEKKGPLVVTELSVHGLLEGMAIGLGYEVDKKVGTIIAIAVIQCIRIMRALWSLN